MIPRTWMDKRAGAHGRSLGHNTKPLSLNFHLYIAQHTTHLLSPDIVLPVVHRHKSPAGVKVEQDLGKVGVLLGTNVDAPRLAVRRNCHAHDERLVVFLTTLAVGQPEVGKVPYKRLHGRVGPLPVFLPFLESAELLLQQQARGWVLRWERRRDTIKKRYQHEPRSSSAIISTW